MPLPHRPAGLTDAAELHRLYAAYDVVELGQQEVDLGDIEAMLTIDGSERRVVVDGEQVVGYADVARSGEVETLAHPEHPQAHEIQRDLLEWVVRRGRERELGRLEHWAGRRPDGAAALLREAGFEHARTLWRMSRALIGDLAEPVWPAGVALRAFDADRDARAVWEVVMAGFGSGPFTHSRPFEEWRALALGPGKDVLQAVEGDRLVALATVGPRTGSGHVGQLTVLPEARGRGLALALLQEAFRRDAAAGWPATTLTVDGENAGARRLYEKAGMTVVAEYHRWERDV
jgi:ribosomal protein S18 acetylase RimI-like enzyme